MRPWPVLLLGLLCLTGCLRAPDHPPVGDPAQAQPAAESFGAPARMTRSLRGDIYLLPGGGDHPPDFRTLRPVGAVYVRALNMPDQDWRTGLPGITSRAEWFALDYNGTFTAKTPGRYRFIPIGNDGSRLIIDGKVVVDDYGVHDAATATGEADLGPGPHRLEAQYFHGPRERLAFQLRCKGPTGPEAVFPGCGLDVGAPSLWRLWLWWVAALAALGAGVIWMTRRRLALEAHGAP